ncbi:MAG TPA: 2-phospho-L-lactate guanylyltransferase [Actinomycetota bacterium]
MRVIAVPIKDLSRAKGRLSGILSPVERAALTLAMLEDVLAACVEMPGWQTWVISPDPSALQQAARMRARPVEERERGLVSAIRQVEEEAANADALAVVLADLPLLTPAALMRALQTLGSVVAAPADSDSGTNLLLRRPPDAIPPRFGTDSFRKHREAAELHDIPFAEVRLPQLAFDLDRPADLTALLASSSRSRTKATCLEMGLPERLAVRKQA